MKKSSLIFLLLALRRLASYEAMQLGIKDFRFLIIVLVSWKCRITLEEYNELLENLIPKKWEILVNSKEKQFQLKLVIPLIINI